MNFDEIQNKYRDCEFAKFFHVEKDSGGEPLFDIVLVREMTGGIYFGERGRLYSPCGSCMGKGCQEAFDTEKYSWTEIERVLRVAFECADSRQKKLCIVDKADVLESSRMWREAAADIAMFFPQVDIEFVYIDIAVSQLIQEPAKFDVIVSSNMFGEILAGVLSTLHGN
ncbi:MAG: isocitrate/isopropylmalate family dehydrogenase [Treponema sp.]|nr:isocitrate/isopropylmalate family dehydrogenase [Treponema sp.]